MVEMLDLEGKLAGIIPKDKYLPRSRGWIHDFFKLATVELAKGDVSARHLRSAIGAMDAHVGEEINACVDQLRNYKWIKDGELRVITRPAIAMADNAVIDFVLKALPPVQTEFRFVVPLHTRRELPIVTKVVPPGPVQRDLGFPHPQLPLEVMKVA